ncbi:MULTISPECIES: hypothetical protein [Clostridium]|jgi:hypothetical protein|uniref:hypothetical protein n=1 Tax=Clostridium TaxID=1485 RepID=UPI000287D927|nr:MULTISPECIES: hypothetical protein [Clostridium]MDF2503783.1 hypothetical protein [Clostridium sp.]
MNKKKMSIIIVSFTLITVFIMIFTSYFRKKIDVDEDKTLILNNKINNSTSKKLDVNNNKSSDNVIKDNSHKDKNNNESTDQSSDKNNDDQFLKNANNNIEDKKSNSENSTEQTDESNKYNSYSNYREDIDQNKNETLFKVSKEKIPSELTFSDKMKILSISKSLSPSDLNKLQVDINNNNEKKGVSDAIHLLKTRLDSKDFNNVEDIASKFINLDAVND